MATEFRAAGELGPARSPLVIHLLSLFPSIFSSWLGQGVVSRAVGKSIVEVRLLDLRSFGVGRHQVTDDYPFGGGVGMVLKPEPVFDAVESIQLRSGTPVILLSPRGRRFTQAVARELASAPEFLLLSGHYEGVDERIRQHLVNDELSIGDYVLSCGELAAMVVVDAVVRLLPGAITTSGADEESFSAGLLEYPHYTRPAEYRGWRVPDVLLSGHHGAIARWRRVQSLLATQRLRPDLFHALHLGDDDRNILREAAGDPEST